MSKPNQTDFEMWQSKKRRYPHKDIGFLKLLMNATRRHIFRLKRYPEYLLFISLMEDTESLLKQIIKQRETCNKNSET